MSETNTARAASGDAVVQPSLRAKHLGLRLPMMQEVPDLVPDQECIVVFQNVRYRSIVRIASTTRRFELTTVRFNEALQSTSVETISVDEALALLDIHRGGYCFNAG